MDILTYSQLQKIVGPRIDKSNGASFLAGLNRFGEDCGLNRPHRLAQYVAQMAHESMGFRHDEEIWGPTPAQERYDTRTDIGNTPQADGDGYEMRGRTGVMITGRYNYRAFTKWARNLVPTAPDFEADPDKVLTDPWEGLGPIWYWDTHDLNGFADKPRFKVAFKGVTRAINGGMNGYADRMRYFDRAALVLLGYASHDIRGFQKKAGLAIDGKPGPLTRQKLHEALLALPPIRNKKPCWLTRLFKLFNNNR